MKRALRSGGFRNTFLLAVAAIGIATGCGGGKQAATGGRASGTARVGGALTVGTTTLPTGLDPLAITDVAQLEVLSQAVEPLVQRLAAPEGHVRRALGLALRLVRNRDGSQWRILLRRNVRFQDRSVLNAEAVAANFRRWRTSTAGRSLLPGLRRATPSGQGVVRVDFAAPLSDLPRRLASPRLGIISPAALRPPSGQRARFTGTTNAGSGPFVVRQWKARATSIVLVRNDRWWGSRAGLGPSLSRIVFTAMPLETERVESLIDGKVAVAIGLSPPSGERLFHDINVQALPGPGGQLAGVRRSVRGFRLSLLAGPEQSTVPLSQAWLTTTTR